MGATTAVALGFIVALELAAVSWCALWPLRRCLGPILLHGGDWRALYNFALSNLDVWLLAVLKAVTLVVLVLAAPAARRPGPGAGQGAAGRRRRGEELPEEAANHKAVRGALGALCGLHAAVLLVKAAGVAVTAPEQLWPAPLPGPRGAAAGAVAVGLVYMYGSIVVSLLSTLLESWLAPALVSEREDAWEAAGAAAEAAEATEAAAEEGAVAGGGGGNAGGGGGGAGAEGESLREPLLPRKGLAAAAGKGAGGGGSGGEGGGGQTGKPKLKQRTLRQLLRLAFVDWPLLLTAFSAGIVAALGSATIPFLTGNIIDFASIDPDRAKFRATTLRLLAVAAATGVFTGTRGGLFTLANTRLNVRLRRRLFHALLQFEVGFFDSTRVGEITSRLAADTSTVADQIGLNMNVMLRSATQAVMVLVFMFSASWRLTVVTFILVPVVISMSQVYGKVYSRLAKKVQAELAGANGVAEEVLSSMATVKAHAAQDSAEAGYAQKLADYYKVQCQEAALYALYAVLTTFLPHAVAAVVLFYGGNLVLAGMMSPGALVSFMLYQQSLTSAFNMMGDVFSALTAAVGAADKVVELMNRAPAIPECGTLALPALEGRLELAGVRFAYPTRPHVWVLRGLSMAVQPGEVVALVGPSGGGKSSIVKLLERFYLPAEGRIQLDGHDLGDLDPKWLRRQVALVSQEPVLYGRSIRRNIVFGLEAEDGCSNPPSEEEIIEAAKQANAHDFIRSFPEGYDTPCGEKGVALSGGQKQRIAIARALVRRPRVLLLDEATSALDADSEAVVQEALDRVMRGRTVLVIAHRLSTVQGADRIYVVGKGAVQEVGTHDELLAAGGVYSQLVRRQITRPLSQANLLPSSGDIRPSASIASLTSLTGAEADGATSTGEGSGAGDAGGKS